MRYAVTLRGQRGATDVVHVEADSGDEAAEKAFRPHHVILSVQPDPPELVAVPDAAVVDSIIEKLKAHGLIAEPKPRNPRRKVAA